MYVRVCARVCKINITLNIRETLMNQQCKDATKYKFFCFTFHEPEELILSGKYYQRYC